MRVLVTGAYGLIGAACLARLYRDGHEVTGAGRHIVQPRDRNDARDSQLPGNDRGVAGGPAECGGQSDDQYSTSQWDFYKHRSHHAAVQCSEGNL